MIDKYQDSKVANELAEPIISSQFRIQIIPNPKTVGLDSLTIDILQEQIKKISGFDAFEKVPETIEQTIGPGTKAHFPGVVIDQTIEMSAEFNVNLRGDDGTDATTFVALKRMKDKQYDRSTGVRGLLKDCAFTVIVYRLTKDGKVWWTATMENCLFQAQGIAGLDEVNLESNDAAVLQVAWKSPKSKVEIVSSSVK